MLLAIDVGNTSISVGLFEKEKLKEHWHFETAQAFHLRDFENLLKSFLGLAKRNPKSVKNIAVSNVVPALAQNFSQIAADLFDAKPFWITHATATIGLRVENPEEVGADRLCNAVAAWEKWKKPVIVVDFGTATTLDIVTAKGEYGGGAILPGIHVAAQALAQSCALLSKVEIKKPKRVVGRNTEECIQAGLYYGYAGMIDHLIALSEAEEKTKMKVVATGGLAHLIAKESKRIESVEPYLTLEGIYYIWQRASS